MEPSTILLAEDSPQIRDFLAESVLRPAGYTVLTAFDGRAALRLAHDQHPDLIIADLQMPGLNGLEVKRALTASGDDTPVILLTGEGSETIASAATLAGVAAYLTKPVDVDVVLAAVAQALSVRRLRRERTAALAALEQRIQQLETLQVIGRALTASLDLAEVLPKVVQAAVRLTGADAGQLFMLEERGVLTLRALQTPEIRTARVQRTAAADILAMQVARSGQPAVFGPEQPVLPGEPGWPALYVPLRLRDVTHGVLGVDNRGSRRAFTTHELGPLLTLADYATIAVVNARLFTEVQQQSTTDVLTGLPNRRHLIALAEREFQRAARYQRPLSALLLDIDHFKRVNDLHGHPTGDEVLIEIGQRARSSIRNMDVVGRYGGEEFVFILPETDATGAAQLAERLRWKVGGSPVSTRSGPLAITVSLGVAGLSAAIRDVNALIEQADAAMYAAKQAGRNRVAVAP